MKEITLTEFDIMVTSDARRLHEKYLQTGVFWSISFCKTEVIKKLKRIYKII